MAYAITDSPDSNLPQREQLFGHPTGLFTLFFAEMWERFSYYGMRALLVFYMLKGFLGYGDSEAYAVYGAYTALVYMTPFFGGILADRILGARRSVIFGGILMAAGHLLMTIEDTEWFYTALALLIVGNGFFKPNISTIVGTLYPENSPKRDGGFTIFYMGINLGAAMSPLLCGYIGETYGWHYGFGLATAGMIVGLCVFVLPNVISQVLIGAGALCTSVALFYYHPDNLIPTLVNVFVGVALLIAAGISVLALGRGGLPKAAGSPPDAVALREPILLGVLSREWIVYLGTLISIPVFVLFVSGFSLVTPGGEGVVLIPESYLEGLETSQTPVVRVVGKIAHEVSRPAGLVLFVAGLVSLGYIGIEITRLGRVQRQRMYVVLILTFFSLLFWAFFEQAGSSINNFTDRNIDRVGRENRVIDESDVGSTITLTPTQEQLGYSDGDQVFTFDDLAAFRKAQKEGTLDWEVSDDDVGMVIQRHDTDRGPNPYTIASSDVDSIIALVPTQDQIGRTNDDKTFTSDDLAEFRQAKEEETRNWTVAADNVGMVIADSTAEIPASYFQSVNPVCILLFGLAFTALWGYLGRRNMEPSTPFKFSLGLFQLGIGFGVLWYGTQTANERGMVLPAFLILGYALHTTGELCLSPVGLSMITKLSPKQLVSTTMGMWFLATAFSQFLAAIIAQFTASDENVIPIPSKTVDVYGQVFQTIAIMGLISAAICFLLTPLLKKWMHTGVVTDVESAP